MSYLLDANVFIAAKNLHYGFDFCPGLWRWIEQKSSDGIVLSIDKVGDEIQAGDDDLSDWAKNLGSALFRPTDTAVAAAFPQVSAWATSQQYEPGAINTFLQAADYYLIAHGLAGGHTIVTHETPSTSVKRIKIPDACVGLQIRFMTPFQMLRVERAQFVLGGAR
ncbi:MAG: DUF4411 family protein [Thermomicrobiales bacterium]|nr:DUF4411 family protein [Thermomicrobiales bacterium]